METLTGETATAHTNEGGKKAGQRRTSIKNKTDLASIGAKKASQMGEESSTTQMVGVGGSL